MPDKRFAAMVAVPRAPQADNNNKYDENYCQMVRDMAQQGMFPEEWCCEIGITMGTLYNWANRYPEFDEAVHIAWWILRAYWTRKARENIQGVGMAPTILLRIIEKRFPDTWGKEPRNTHQTFTERPGQPLDGQSAAAITPEAAKTVADEDLRARIKQLQDRRSAEE